MKKLTASSLSPSFNNDQLRPNIYKQATKGTGKARKQISQRSCVPLQEEYQENGKIGDVVHVSFPIQDQGKAGDQLFPEYRQRVYKS